MRCWICVRSSCWGKGGGAGGRCGGGGEGCSQESCGCSLECGCLQHLSCSSCQAGNGVDVVHGNGGDGVDTDHLFNTGPGQASGFSCAQQSRSGLLRMVMVEDSEASIRW